MGISNDVKAPVFKLKDIYGRLIDLEAFSNKKVLLAFFRHAGCPFCNLRVHSLLKVHSDLQAKGLEMIFFFESKEQIILRSSFHKGISPIPIISDPEKIWYNTYGLENSAYKSTISHLASFVQTAFKAKSLGLPIHAMESGESINTIPAEFLINRGFVKEVHYSQRLNDRMNLQKIIDFAEKDFVTHMV